MININSSVLAQILVQMKKCNTTCDDELNIIVINYHPYQRLRDDCDNFYSKRRVTHEADKY